ncbi:MAG: hypothetical protein CW338_11670 [Clostridiales bacterium]|nr:hypothetical protein [Clostridiales bacterium]
MKCIDFDKEFQRYMTVWLKEHKGEYKNYDEVEERMPEIYEGWLETPLDWLGNKCPGAYFEQFDNARMLVRHMEDYIKQRIAVPDMLMNRITDLGRDSEQPLFDLLCKETAGIEAKMSAITMLRELGSELPVDMYIGWVRNTGDGEDELAENALESLDSLGEIPVEKMRAALADATPGGKESFCSLLCHYEDPDETVFGILMDLLNAHPERCAVLADYLGKLGNEKALDRLKALAASEETGYLDYIELRSAIEMLGGDCPEREFDANDPDYDALRGME